MTTARIEYVYFPVIGSNDEALHAEARRQLTAFSSTPHGYKIRAEAKLVDNDGSVLIWTGEVTAWPEEP